MSLYQRDKSLDVPRYERVRESVKSNAPEVGEITDAEAALILDVSDMLVGPTSGGNAMFLAVCMFRSAGGEGLAKALRQVADNFNKGPEVMP